MFDFHAEWFARREFFGCMSIKAVAEFPDPASGPYRIAREHKRAIVAFLGELCRGVDLRDPDGVAEQMNLLLEGAVITARVSANGSGLRHDLAAAARVAMTIAERLLAATSSG